jgi:hypothetical protein
MKAKRPGGALPMLIALLLLALLLTMYGVGYFLLSEKFTGFVVKGNAIVPSDTIHRGFGHPWLATGYQPAGEVESRLRGVPVHVYAN